MEEKLKKLFDYQRFEKNDRLGKMIRETEDRYARELSDDLLFYVSAAGEAEKQPVPGEKSETGGQNSSSH